MKHLNQRIGTNLLKDELISWIHSNMIHHEIPPIIREKILKKINEEIFDKIFGTYILVKAEGGNK